MMFIGEYRCKYSNFPAISYYFSMEIVFLLHKYAKILNASAEKIKVCSQPREAYEILRAN